MAEAQLGVLLQSLAGKAGTAVFQRSSNGIVVRPRVKGANPRTPAQEAVRAALTKASRDWASFNPAQVAEWRQFASFQVHHDQISGKGYKPQGINAYMELACKFYLVNPNGTAPTTPPATPFEGDTVTITATADTGTITFTASGANAANVTTEFLLQPLRNANRKPQKNGYRSKGFFAFSAGNLSHEIEVPSGYYAAGYRFVNSATGQATEPKYLTVQQVTLSLASGKDEKGTGKAKKAA